MTFSLVLMDGVESNEVERRIEQYEFINPDHQIKMKASIKCQLIENEQWLRLIDRIRNSIFRRK